MKNTLIFWWQNFRYLFICLIIVVILFARVLFVAGGEYISLSRVVGKIESVDYQDAEYTELRISIESDKRVFYQRYQKRLNDDKAATLKKGEDVVFFTTTKPILDERPWSPPANYQDFYYHPIFNMNANKSFFDIFLFCLYDLSLFNIVLIFACAGTLFYSMPIVMTCRWDKRIAMILAAGFVVWLFY